MDIAALSMNMSQVSLENQVQLSVMKISMENCDIINDNMTKMIDNMAVDLNLGTNLDFTV